MKLKNVSVKVVGRFWGADRIQVFDMQITGSRLSEKRATQKAIDLYREWLPQVGAWSVTIKYKDKKAANL